MQPPRRCAVVGAPIAHSLSPALHRAAYAALGLDWTYGAVLVDSAGLEEYIDGLDESWRGLSLTMPLKRTVVPLLDTSDDWVRLSGVANTLVIDPGSRHGFNTDIPGAIAAMQERLPSPPESAVVLGGGATATSVLLALAELGCRAVTVLVRDPARAEETVAVVSSHPNAPELTVRTIADVARVEADLLVTTIPAEAQTPGCWRRAPTCLRCSRSSTTHGPRHSRRRSWTTADTWLPDSTCSRTRPSGRCSG